MYINYNHSSGFLTFLLNRDSYRTLTTIVSNHLKSQLSEPITPKKNISPMTYSK